MGSYPPWVRRHLDIVPTGNSCRAPTLWAQANQRSVDENGISTPCVEQYEPGGSVFRARMVGGVALLYMYRRLADPGIGLHLSPAPLTPKATAYKLSGNEVGVSTPCGAVSARGVAVFVPGWSELMDGSLNWGWDPLLPACDGASMTPW